MVQIKNQIISKIAHHQRQAMLAKQWKNGTVSYHKWKAEAYQEALAIILEHEKVGV